MLQAEKLTYTQRSHNILHNVNVNVAPGELLVIVGPNGAGKSTLLNLLAHESTKAGRSVLFKNKMYAEWDTRELPLHKAKFSQSNSQDIPLKVEDIVMMGRYPYFNSTPAKADRAAVAKAMEQTDVNGLSGRDYNLLSGGEKQRVHLARVLAQMDNEVGQKLVFFDEPLNNLDVLHQHRILHTVKNFTEQGNTAVMVLHDLNLAAQFADRVLLLKKGRVVAHDVPGNVFTKDIISKVYNFPCVICPNPVNKNPLIIFGSI